MFFIGPVKAVRTTSGDKDSGSTAMQGMHNGSSAIHLVSFQERFNSMSPSQSLKGVREFHRLSTGFSRL
jgi:hypothetical protein